MLSTSENILFPGHNHLLTTGTDDATLWLSPEHHCVRIFEKNSAPSHQALDWSDEFFYNKIKKKNKKKHTTTHTHSKLFVQAIDDPSSNQFRDPPTYTHQPSMQQKVPFSLIRCSSSKVAFCSCVEWGWHIYNIVESESDPLTRRAVDLFEKEPLKGNSEVHLHTPTKFGEDRSKDLGGDREQTDRQTNRQTDKRCSIYSMIKFDNQDINLVWPKLAYKDTK